MFLLVDAKGNRRWQMGFRFGGKRKSLALGPYPAVGLKEARIARDEARKLLSEGVDPCALRKAEKQAAKNGREQLGDTFEAVARDWFEKKKPVWAESHAKRIMERIQKYLVPTIGSRPIGELRKKDYVAALSDIEQRGKLDTVKRVANIASQISRYAEQRGIIEVDCAAGLASAFTPPKHKPQAAILDREIFGRLLLDIDTYEGRGETAVFMALKIMSYVFVRSPELREARWNEVNFKDNIWIIPAERMKARRSLAVPLKRQTTELFQKMHEKSGYCGLVFPSLLSNTRPISDMGLLNALRRLGCGREEMRIHGFRVVASTFLNQMGYNPDWIERQLAHEPANKVRAAYNRADYLEERKVMMQEWADYIDKLRNEAAARQASCKNKRI